MNIAHCREFASSFIFEYFRGPSMLPLMKRDKKSRLIDERAVKSLKRLIGERIKTMRGKQTQDALQELSGVDRSIIIGIEKASRDYRINSLLAVVSALRADETVIFADDPLSQNLYANLKSIVKSGNLKEIAYVADAMDRALGVIEATARSPSATSKPKRSA